MKEKRISAVDCWINPNPPEVAKKKWASGFLRTVAEDYFHRWEKIAEGTPITEMVKEMESAGIEKGIITSSGTGVPVEMVADLVKTYPKKFIGSIGVDPFKGMDTVREIERAVKDYGIKLIRILPFLWNKAPNDKVYYPIYTKCIELDIPVGINVGIPGPPVPGECMNPIYLDEVCLFFPELKIIMSHGAHPYCDIAIRLMLKYKNLYLMMSAWAPKYYPKEILQYMNTRGSHKILFATDYPLLPFERCVREAMQLPVKEEVLKRFMRENALELFDWS
jgi:predicted TIM-barrel fold metal-dependent hydrolase